MEVEREALLPPTSLLSGYPARLLPLCRIQRHHATHGERGDPRRRGLSPLPPQLIKLDVECTGNPKVKKFEVPTKQKVTFQGKAHMQFNCMYVCTLKVANDRHGLTAQPENAGIAVFGFLDSAEADRGGGGDGGGSNGGGGGQSDGGAPYASDSDSD